MVTVLFYGVALMNFVISAIRKKNNFFAGMAYVAIFILMTYNSEGPDIANYINGYLNSMVGNTGFGEGGFNLLMKLGNIMHLNFYSFRAVLTIVCLLLLHNTIKFYNTNENSVISLYMLFLFFMDTIQIRNFVVEIIFIYSTRFLIQDKAFDSLKYIICILVASLFHAIAPIYLILLVCKFVRTQKIYKLILIFSICSFVFFMLFRNCLNYIVMFAANLAGVKMEYATTSTFLGFVPVVGIYFLGLLAIYIYCKKVNRSSSFNVKLNGLKNIHLALLILLPLLLINTNFYRVFRNALLLTLMCFCMKVRVRNKTIKWSAPLIAFILNLLWWFTDVILYNNISRIIIPIFSNNLFFENTNIVIILETFCVSGIMLLLYILLYLFIFDKNKQKLCKSKCQIRN